MLRNESRNCIGKYWYMHKSKMNISKLGKMKNVHDQFARYYTFLLLILIIDNSEFKY